jgi:hypothetical protein
MFERLTILVQCSVRALLFVCGEIEVKCGSVLSNFAGLLVDAITYVLCVLFYFPALHCRFH